MRKQVIKLAIQAITGIGFILLTITLWNIWQTRQQGWQITLIVGASLAILLVQGATGKLSKELTDFYRNMKQGWTWKTIPTAVVLYVIFLATTTLTAKIPGMTWSLYGGGTGHTYNDLLYTTPATTIILLVAFAILIGIIVWIEEDLFRGKWLLGTTGTPTQLRQMAIAGTFGAAHLTIGYTIATAVAITVIGYTLGIIAQQTYKTAIGNNYKRTEAQKLDLGEYIATARKTRDLENVKCEQVTIKNGIATLTYTTKQGEKQELEYDNTTRKILQQYPITTNKQATQHAVQTTAAIHYVYNLEILLLVTIITFVIG